MVMKDWRRKHVRISSFIPTLIRYSVLVPGAGGKSETRQMDGWGVIQDISLGGIRLETRAPLKQGQIIFISFSVSTNFIFTNTKGVIRHISRDGFYSLCGIEFESMRDQEHLRNAIEEYLTSSHMD